ncbi:MAG: transposase [Opitutaceae bacterium]|nr:transposase [Opitutaceae bacterium]
MARKPRVQFAGAIYHVMNRGNYKEDMFATPGAAQAFVDCLWETCEQTKWKVYAYCVMRNHYHLAIQTPEGNLVEGVHWLQSTFGNRFNRFRRENGRAFQGRYKAILIEPGMRLLYLTCYLHLNPVRARIIPFEQVADFRWSSYRAFTRLKMNERPAPLAAQPWLSELGGARDNKDGWKVYHSYLERMSEERKLRAEAGFDEMSRGWVFGSDDYRRARLNDLAVQHEARDWGGAELAEIARAKWERSLDEGLECLQGSLETVKRESKSADWKVALATWMKTHTTVTNRWLGERLHMGAPDGVSRYCSECRSGQRAGALKILARLDHKD